PKPAADKPAATAGQAEKVALPGPLALQLACGSVGFGIQRSCACGGQCPECREEEPLQRKARDASGDSAPGCYAHVVQTSLKVGPTDDAYEREADQVAHHVMRMPVLPGSAGVDEVQN